MRVRDREKKKVKETKQIDINPNEINNNIKSNERSEDAKLMNDCCLIVVDMKVAIYIQYIHPVCLQLELRPDVVNVGCDMVDDDTVNECIF